MVVFRFNWLILFIILTWAGNDVKAAALPPNLSTPPLMAQTANSERVPNPVPPRQSEQPTLPLLPSLEELLDIPIPTPVAPEKGPTTPGTITVTRFEFEGNTAFSNDKLNQKLADFTNRSITFAELLETEAIVTDFYVNAGYVNSGAYIQPQTIRDGVVKIRVVEGSLEDIQVSGTHRLNPNYVRRRLALAASPPLNANRLLQALQLLQLDPLIKKLEAELATGSRPDRSLLQVRVTEAKSFSAQLNLDNGRNPSVGSFRRGIKIREANLLGLGDSWSAAYTNTDGSHALDISYSLPLNSRNGSLNLAYGRTDSDVIETPFDRVDITGDSRYYELTLRQPVFQTPNREVAIGLIASRQESETTLLGDGFPLSPGADDRGRTRISALRWFQEYTRRSPREVFAARSQFSLGVGVLNATINSEAPDSHFLAWRGQAQYIRLLAPETFLVLRSDAQLASRTLVPLEQFGLGGFRSVRGYRQDVFLTDNGAFASAEILLPIVRFSRQQDVLQLVPFVDVGTAWNSSGRENPAPNTLLGIGLGLQLQLDEGLTARLDYGIPLIDVDSRGKTWQENGLYFSIDYRLF